jgi:uncharacterized membrane protein
MDEIDGIVKSIMAIISLVLLAFVLQYLYPVVSSVINIVLNSGIMSTDFWEVGLAIILLAISTITVAIKVVNSLNT